MTAVYPSTLPAIPLASGGLQGRFVPNSSSFQPDQGRPIRRRRYSGRFREESFSLMMTDSQLRILFDWFEQDLADGTEEFTFTSQASGASHVCWFLDGSPPSYAYIGTTEIGDGVTDDQYTVTYNLGIKV